MTKAGLVLSGLFLALAGIGLYFWGYQENKSWKAFLGGILGGLGVVFMNSTPLPEGHVFQIQNGHPIPFVG